MERRVSWNGLERLRYAWHKTPGFAWGMAIAWIGLIGGLAFLWHLGSTGLVDETEPLFAEAARQMTVTGDWITPYFNSDTRFDKPPLVYWLMAMFYQTIGVNEWAVRLPSALSAIALMGMGFYTLRRFGNPAPDPNAATSTTGPFWFVAFMGAALIALHPSTIIWGRTGVSDMLLSGCIGLALMTFFCGYATGETRDRSHPFPSAWYLACYGFIALAILAKGPVGIVLPGLIMVAFLFYIGNLRVVLREMRPLWGILIILAIALPWYVLVTLANGEEYIESFFGYHNIERFTEVVNNHQGPWYFYFGVVLLGFAPWSVYLPVAIARLQVWRRSLWQHQPRSRQLGIFALLWFAVIFSFFTIATTKLPSYVLPLMPAAAFLVAMLLSQQLGPVVPAGWGMKLSGLLNGVFFLVLAGALVYAPRLVAADPKMPELTELLQISGLPILGGAIALVAALVILWLTLRRQRQWLWLANIVVMVALVSQVLMPAAFIIDAQRQQPLRELSLIARQVHQPGEKLVMVGFKKPSVVFYSQQEVTFKARRRAAVPYLQEVATTEPVIPSVLILSSPRLLMSLALQPNQYENLGQMGAYQLVRVQKQVLAQVLPKTDVFLKLDFEP